jgi:hypothetical protein
MNGCKCLAILLVLGAAPGARAQEPNLTAEEVIALVRTNLSKFESIKLRFTTRELENDEPPQGVEGTWVYRNDGHELMELKHLLGSMAGRVESFSRTPETNRSLVEIGPGQRKAGIVERALPHWEVHMVGRPRRFFMLPYLDEREERIRQDYVAEGWEVIDGHRCFKFSVLSMHDPTKPQFHLRDRFWLDVERGGHALQWEKWVSGRLTSRVSDVRLHSLEGGLWIPVQTREEFHWKRDKPATPAQTPPTHPRFKVRLRDADGNWIDEKDLPTELHVVVEVMVDLASIEVNAPLEDREVELAFPVATQVVDQVEGKRFFQGGVRPNPPGTSTAPPTQQSLDEFLAKAESQRQTVEATSLQRSRWGIWTITLMACISALLIVGGVLLIQRRGA